MGLDQKFVQVLAAIIEEYVETAEPVGSLELAQKYDMDMSSATIRNYMNYLEDEGFLYQPHISAGRIPTETAYRFYLENFVPDARVLPKNIQSRIESSMSKWKNSGLTNEREVFLKSVAKMLAEISGDLAVVEFKPNGVYCTGLTYLFEQPEFGENSIVISTCRFIDQVDEMMNVLRDLCTDDVEVFMGVKNPVDRHFSVILGRYQFRNDDCSGVFGLVGPLRMPYQKNIALMRLIRDQLSQIA